MIIRAVLLICLSQLLCTAAFAVDMSVFGLELGKPLALPECQKNDIAGTWNYNFGVSKVCLKESFPTGKPPDLSHGYVNIAFPINDQPQISKSGEITAIVSKGKLVGVKVWTAGLSAQDIVLNQLVAKYGKPTTALSSDASNAYGAKFDVDVYGWKFGTLNVVFFGAVTSITEGLVEITTPEGDAVEKEESDKISNFGKKL